MTNTPPTEKTLTASNDANSSPPSPLRCAIGSLIAGAMGTGMYSLTSAIAQSFAAKPIQSQNITVINITVAVRTLVVGISTLATAVFSLIAIGLFALGIQVLIQQLKNQLTPPQK